MDPSVKAYLMSQGLYEFTLGGYPSKDSGNNIYTKVYKTSVIRWFIQNVGIYHNLAKITQNSTTLKDLEFTDL